MDTLGKDITICPNEIEQDKEDLMEDEIEGTVDPLEKILEGKINMQVHKDNEDYASLSYVYSLGKGQCDNKNLNVNDIKEKKTLSGNTALHIAARYGINEVVKTIAKADIQWSFSSVNSNQDKVYHVAARAGQISTLQMLLEVYVQHFHDYGADVRCRVDMLTEPNKQGNTIFHEALINGGRKGATIFEALASPIMVNDKEGAKSFFLKNDVYGEEVALSVNKEGKTPLFLAVEFGYEKIVKRLLKNCKRNFEGKSPIYPAIVNGYLDTLGIILAYKPEWIHIKDDKGWLPLHYAAYFGHLGMICLLLNVCTSCTLINTNKDGMFPLHLASRGGHVEVFQKLLKYCLDPYEMLNSKGQNVLHIAARWGNRNVVTCILQDPELENIINQKDYDGNTPLHLAARFSRLRVVRALAYHKRVDLIMVNNEKKTALDIARDQAQQTNPTFRQRQTRIALSTALRRRKPSKSRVTRAKSSYNVPDDESEEASLKKKSQDRGPKIERMKYQIETLLVISTLIVTVTFAAGIQFPGGINDKDGQAKLLEKGMFQLYIICITTSMYGALVAIAMLFIAGTDFVGFLQAAMILLAVSLTALSMAFLAAVYLVISKLTWLVSIFLLMSIIFVLVVATMNLLFIHVPINFVLF